GSFQARIPAGMSVLQKGGEETQSLFSVHRTGPSQVAIEDGSTGKTIDHSCGDPCVVDGRTLLDQLSR
ncbi:MAG TPA: hypothetical protein VND65_03325, partial [Candidatus Binatia bacterium]|nr:hypothetical protein [Candidatus Binatia bacterium]